MKNEKRHIKLRGALESHAVTLASHKGELLELGELCGLYGCMTSTSSATDSHVSRNTRMSVVLFTRRGDRGQYDSYCLTDTNIITSDQQGDSKT